MSSDNDQDSKSESGSCNTLQKLIHEDSAISDEESEENINTNNSLRTPKKMKAKKTKAHSDRKSKKQRKTSTNTTSNDDTKDESDMESNPTPKIQKKKVKKIAKVSNSKPLKKPRRRRRPPRRKKATEMTHGPQKKKQKLSPLPPPKRKKRRKVFSPVRTPLPRLRKYKKVLVFDEQWIEGQINEIDVWKNNIEYCRIQYKKPNQCKPIQKLFAINSKKFKMLWNRSKTFA